VKSSFKHINSNYESPLGENSSFGNARPNNNKLQIDFIGGPFDKSNNLVSAISRFQQYYYLISFNRQINANDINKVTWGVSYDDNTDIFKLFSGGRIIGNQLKVFIKVGIDEKGNFFGINKCKIYAYIGDIPNKNIFKEVFYKKTTSIFIGGAADKNKYAVFLGPTNIIELDVKNGFDEMFDSFDSIDYTSIYLGFEEVYEIKRITKNVLNEIPDKSVVSVNIIGHSLGGWNGAHLSNILSSLGYSVNTLITLDPVGQGIGVTMVSNIYWEYPEPISLFWINTRCKPDKPDGTDRIAEDGKRWIIESGPSVNFINPHHHAEAGAMFFDDIVKYKMSIATILYSNTEKYITSQ